MAGQAKAKTLPPLADAEWGTVLDWLYSAWSAGWPLPQAGENHKTEGLAPIRGWAGGAGPEGRGDGVYL